MSLLLGCIAALAWGVHDLCVRWVSQRTGIMTALGTVLIIGAAVLLPVVAIFGNWAEMDGGSSRLAVLSGAIYAIGCIGLYKAFEIGPVRLVAPIIGAYPVLSLLWAGAGGQVITAFQWAAVALVIAGVATVAALSGKQASDGKPLHAVAWSLLGGAGFAGTFAVGQAAAAAGDELTSVLLARLVTIAVVAVIALAAGGVSLPRRAQLPILGLMGVLDAGAIALVIASGSLPRPEYAAVAASMFGMLTIVLAAIFLRERMTGPQWTAAALAFVGIGALAL